MEVKHKSYRNHTRRDWGGLSSQPYALHLDNMLLLTQKRYRMATSRINNIRNYIGSTFQIKDNDVLENHTLIVEYT
jgi:hypothetical protein